MGNLYATPRLRLAPSSPRTRALSQDEVGILRSPTTTTNNNNTEHMQLPFALAETLARSDTAESLAAAVEALPPQTVQAFVRAAVQDGAPKQSSPTTSSSSSSAPSSPRFHRPRRTLSSDSLPTLRANALASAMARPSTPEPTASSWRTLAHPPKEGTADLRRWRSCGTGAFASGTQSKYERNPRFRGSDDRVSKSEVRVVRTSPDSIQSPVRSIQPPGGLMLRRLSLSGCELATDDALATVLRVTDLVQLCLDRCVRLTDDALEAVASQPAMRELSLAGCRQLGNNGVNHLRTLSALRVLSLERCGRVTDEGLVACLLEWNKLEVLNVAFCYKLTVKSLCGVSSCHRLAYLDARSTRVTSELWASIRHLKRLRALYVANTAVSDKGVEALEGVSTLRALDVAGTQTGDGLLASVTNACLSLETLNLAYTSVTDGGVAKYVTKMRTLRWLSLDDTDVGDYAVERMGALSSLTSLNLADTQVTAFGVGAVAGLSTLRSLDLSFTGVTDAALRGVARLTGLQRLAVDGEHVTDKGAVYIGRLRALRELELYGAAVTDHGAAHIANCSQMRTLEMCLGRVGDTGAMALAQGMRHLRHVDLSQNKVGSFGIVALLQTCRQLDTLNFAYCQEVDSGTLGSLASHPTLVCACLQGTSISTTQAAYLRRSGLVVVCDVDAHTHTA